MWRYPDRTFKQNSPSKVEKDGYIVKFSSLTSEEQDALGYNEAVPVNRDSEYIYDTAWEKDDLVYNEINVTAPVFREAELFPVYLERKQAEIKDGADSALSEPAARFSMREQVSWAQQAYEAREWTHDNTFHTPMIDGIISVTGETKSDFCATVLANETGWSAIAGPVFGQRQMYTDQLNEATTCAEIKAIDVKYTIPNTTT